MGRPALCTRESLQRHGFTRYNLCACAVCAVCAVCERTGHIGHIERTGSAWTDLYSVVTCTSWGVCAAFYVSVLVDGSAFRRLAAQKKVGMAFFHIASIVVHLLPCIVTLVVRPSTMDWWHGVVAIAAHLAWGVAVSDGTLRLDQVYVPMSPAAWCAMWIVAVATEAMACLLAGRG